METGVKMLDSVCVHPSWLPMLTDQVVKRLGYIENTLYTLGESTPDIDKRLRFLSTDLSNTKVVILGQDPYKPAGVANGRSFQPADLETWHQPFRQVSLKNIVRSVYATYAGIDPNTQYGSIPNWSWLLSLMGRGEFEIKQPKQWFDSLESQGVLFLNASLTTKVGLSGAHEWLWEEFTDWVVQYIDKAIPGVRWFDWGNSAIRKSAQAVHGVHFRSRHPMMCSGSYPDDFIKNLCFRETAGVINWLG